ncbi:MAG: hypothetical protein MJZ57_02390 [Bacteroidales bacterium]|nr:hypothetical protein [Bacteroidales bacterium]
MDKEKLNFTEKAYYFLKHVANKITYSQDLFDDEVWKIRLSKKPQKRHKYTTEKSLFSLSLKSTDDIYKYLLLVMMAFMLLVMLHMSKTVGISTRELAQNHYTELVYNHFHHIGNVNAYKEHPYASTQAQYIDLLVYSIGQTLNFKDIFLVRHMISAIFGWLLILYLSILILKAFSWRAAFFTAFFLFISPRFIGYSISNLVDVTFAFGFVFTITQIYYFCRELPVIRIYRLVKIILGTLLAISTYNAGFVLMHFFFLFTVLNFIIYNPLKKFYKIEYLKPLGLLIAMVWCVTAFVYITHGLSTLFLIKSTVAPRHAFSLLAMNYPVSENQLFAGHVIGPDNFPKRYLSQYFFITIPTVVIIGFILFFIFFKSAIKTLKPFSVFIFLYAFFYCINQVKSHYMNPDTMWAIYYAIYSMFMLIAVSGVECALRSINDRYANFVVMSIIALLSFLPIRHIAFNQPAFIYFNGISGGINDCYAKYDVDYNSQTNKAACNWMRSYLNKHEVGRHADDYKYTIATDGNEACQRFFRADTNCILTHQDFNATDTTWDYFISFCKDIPAAQLRNGTWPSGNTLYRLKIDNRTIVAFYENEYRAQQRAIRDSIAQVLLDSIAQLQQEEPAK